jgi:DNA-binding protein HU-beta
MLSKSQLITKIAEGTGQSKNDVKAVLDQLADVGYAELRSSGQFTIPGYAKFVVVDKPAVPEREGINPFTGEKAIFKAKPASKAVKARPVKAVKDAV